jgi:crotonobetainyl-CoA:carnitine CoA-transferase CaiB-like acyl-CoA transferase
MQIISRPELAEDPLFLDMVVSRGKNEKELDSIIESWTSQRERDWMVSEFCKAGLAACASRDARDVYADEHFRERIIFCR